MNHNYFRSSVNLFFLCVMLQPTIALAAIRMGTRTLSVGETTRLEVANQYQTATGSWKISEGNACRISARSTKSCEITAIRAGKCTVTWTGVIDAGFYDDYYWDITVEGGGVGGGGTSDDGEFIYANTIEGVQMRFYKFNSWEVSLPEKCIGTANGRVTIPSTVGDYTVTYIGNAAFYNISGLTELVIPNTVTNVQQEFILGCDNLQSVVCEATTPPNAPDDNLGIGTAILYVPKGCKSLYRTANGWKSVPYIMEIGDEGKIALAISHSGGEVEKGTKVYLHSNPSGANIYYTTDNSTPTKNSNKYSSTSGIVVNETTTLKVIAYKDGYIESDVLTVNYIIKQTTPIEKSVEINATNFPDENFRKYLLEQNYGKDGVITEDELMKIQTIDVSGTYSSPGNIASLQGIEFFTALLNLLCEFNQLTSLDVSNNTELNYLCCNKNHLVTINLSRITKLKRIDCEFNQLTSLDVSKNTALTDLNCYDNQLTSLDVSRNTALTYLRCYKNQLTSLDVSRNTALTYLHCYENQLTSLDISKNTALTSLDCSDNQLTSLDVSRNTALTYLNCYKNQLTSLDISKNTALTYLNCYNNQLTSLDISKNTALTDLSCSNNQLTSLDISKNTALTYLSCSNNQLTSLDVSRNTALITLSCYENQIKNKSMDDFISSLSNNYSSKEHKLYIVSNPATDGNVCTTTQVAAIKSKGWTPYYYDSGWKEYAGSDPTAIKGIPEEDTTSVPIYKLNGQRLGEPRKGINIIGGKKVVVK